MIDLTPIVDIIKGQYLSFGYLIVFLAVFLKHIILVSLVWPGGTLLIVGVVFAVSGQLSFLLILLFAWLGALLGNTANYVLGRKGVLEIIKASRFYPRIERYMNLAFRFMKKHGRSSIFLAQFLGHLRPLVSILAGGVKMPFQEFFIFQLPAVIIWYLIYCGLGFFLAKTVNIDDLFSTVTWVIVGLAVFLVLIFNLFFREKFEAFIKEEEN